MPSGLRGRHITTWDDYNTSSNQLDNALKLLKRPQISMQKESRIIPDIIFVKNEPVLSCYWPMEADSL